jgi:hypothetical protein
LPHVSFDVAAFLAHAHHVNPKLRVFPVSAQTGEGSRVVRLAARAALEIGATGRILDLVALLGFTMGCATRSKPTTSPRWRACRRARRVPRRSARRGRVGRRHGLAILAIACCGSRPASRCPSRRSLS